jgi:lysine-specific demethylase/histidyl-hydroxylase NO66
MSRAVLRKRKRLSKHQVSSLLHHQSTSKTIRSSEDKKANISNNDDIIVDDDDDDDDHDEMLELHDIHNGNNIGNNDFCFHRYDESDGYRDEFNELDMNSLTLLNILNMPVLHHDMGLDFDISSKSSLVLQKLIHPVSVKDFYNNYYQQVPFKCIRNDHNYFMKYFTKKTLDNIINDQLLYEDVNITVGSQLKKDDRGGIDVEKEINRMTIWNRFNNAGGTIRLLTPQVYDDKTWKLLSILEHQFDCPVKAVVHVLPSISISESSDNKSKKSNGMTKEVDNDNDIDQHDDAKHACYDNYDAIIIQLEGFSSWRIMNLNKKEQSLPTTNSESNISSKDIASQWDTPTIDCKLSPGDTLYIPKGWLYYVENGGDAGQHAMFMKICFCESSNVSELLQLIVPQAMAVAVDSNIDLRKSLPRHYYKYIGVSASESNEEVVPSTVMRKREEIKRYVSCMMKMISDEVDELIDPAADQLRKQFIMQRLPIPLSSFEESRSASTAPRATIYPFTQLRIIQPGIAIAVIEDGKVVLCHCMDNSRQVYGAPLKPLEFELDDGPAIEALLTAYPHSITVSDLDHPSEEMDDKIGIAEALYKEGILLICDEASNPSDSSSRVKKRSKSIQSVTTSKSNGQLSSTSVQHDEDDDNDPF